jgi:hypothetical protein
MRLPLPITVLALCCAVASADQLSKRGITPIEAELSSDLNARILKVGSAVYARVSVDWQGANCTLTAGAILEAHVLLVVPHTKTVKDSELGLAFTGAQCGEPKLGEFPLVLAAMAAPPEQSDYGIMSASLPVNTGSGGTSVKSDAIASLKSSAAANWFMESEFYRSPLALSMKMGQVSGIRGLTLSVATGPEHSSVLTSRNHDVSLDKHTLLMLVPAQGIFPLAAVISPPGPSEPPNASQPALPSASSGVSSASGPGAGALAEPPADDIDLCVPPQCNQALPSGAAINEGNPASSISIKQLGYAARPQRVIKSFDQDEALAYLGPRELLVAFNPHVLVSRQTVGRSGPIVRVIRAVLLDTETHRIRRSVDWELPDNRQYLWPLSGGRVLVHVGSELRVYGEGLKIENRISLAGPLAFVRVTPNSGFMAIGVIHERHSPELHAQLEESLNADPEEDVGILVLNSNFETIATSTAHSGVMAPTLLNEGQATLLALPKGGYRIALRSWDNRTSTIARFTSSCTPEISSIEPDLVFLISCEKFTYARQYRLLRPDGKLALKGVPMLNECGHAAEGSADQKAFVVKVVQSSLPLPPGEPFSSADFSAEELRVYRVSDGKRLLGVRVASPSSSRDGYALAPDASELAVLTRDQIAIYSVPAK